MPKGIKGFQKGHPNHHTEESKKKISEKMKIIMLGNKHNLGKHHSKETRQKISKGNKGKKVSKLAKRKISITMTGKSHPHRGYKLTKEHRLKLSIALRGDKSYFWKGGISLENSLIRLGIETKLWRESVFARDNYICQKCEQKGGILHPHHIFNFATYLDLRFAIDNGITLCKNCHKLFHKIYGTKNNTKEQINIFLNEKDEITKTIK